MRRKWLRTLTWSISTRTTKGSGDITKGLRCRGEACKRAPEVFIDERRLQKVTLTL